MKKKNTNNSPLDALHEMGDITSDSVTQPLRGDDGYLISQPLVGLEVQSEARVVLLDDDAGRFFDGLCPNTNLPIGGKEKGEEKQGEEEGKKR